MRENSSTKNMRKMIVVIQNEFNLELRGSQDKNKMGYRIPIIWEKKYINSEEVRNSSLV